MCCRYIKKLVCIVPVFFLVEWWLVKDSSFLLFSSDLNSSIDKYLSETKSSKKDQPEAASKSEPKKNQDINWRIDATYTYTDRVMKVVVTLETGSNFSVFKEDLSFYLDSGSEPVRVLYPKSFKRQDPIKRVMRDSFKDKDQFEIYFIPMYESKKMMVRYSACTVGKCLFPTVQTLNLKCIEENFGSGLDLESIKKDQSYIQKVEKNPGEEKTEYHLQEFQLGLGGDRNLDFTQISFWLVVMLFLAGILTNCTPCVAPMIPITVGIMVKNSKKLTPCFYSLGICLTYTILGVISVLAGKVFGFLMYSTWMNLCFAGFMFLVAIGMLHDGSFSRVQSFFGKGLTETRKIKSEYLTTFIKGVLAGGLAAPCTGPVLAALLTYIASSQNVYYGITLMFVYSLGFSLPYLVLGIFSKGVTKIRISIKLQRIIKIVFASLMFALCFYYLRNIFYREFEKIWIYMVVVSCLLALGFLLVYRKKQKNYLTVCMSLACGCLLFFLYLGINSIFRYNLNWVYSEKEAVQVSIKEEKPILLDNWANWCSHCHMAEKYLATSRDKISSFVLWKQDLSKDNELTQLHIEKYNLKSLPVFILIYPGEGKKIDASLYDQGEISTINMDMKYFNDIHDLLKWLDDRKLEAIPR